MHKVLSRWSAKSLLMAAGLLTLGVAGEAIGERSLLVVGGKGANNVRWQEKGNKITAFDVTPLGALELREYAPYQNILRTLDAPKDLTKAPYNGGWYMRSGPDYGLDMGYVEGEDPVDFGTRMKLLSDGDPKTYWALTIPTWSHLNDAMTFSTGLPIRANRFVFYPPREGMAADVQTPYPETYMKAYEVSGDMFGPPRIEPSPPVVLRTLLRREPNNFESIVALAFPLQTFRFFRLMNTTSLGFSVAEIEVYGEGFAPQARFTSRVIAIPGDQPVNFGAVYFAFTKLRWQKKWEWTGGLMSEDLDTKRRARADLWKISGGDAAPVLLGGDAPVSISVEVRTGSDDSPLVYHKVNSTGDGEEVITMEEFFQKCTKGPRPADVNPITNPLYPNNQGSVTDDVENWSPWSSPEAVSGMSPGVRDFQKYVQFRVNVESGDVWSYGRLDSLWIEYSSPLAGRVVGEVAALDEPQPLGGIAELQGGEEVSLSYDVKATFQSPRERGFDVLRIRTPSRASLEELYQGGVAVVPPPRWQWNEGGRMLEVTLPKKVDRNASAPVRVVLRTVVLAYGTVFDGEVIDSGSGDLPQSIESGNASDAVSTNSLQVNVTEESLKKVLMGVSVMPNPMTPDGDGVNDVTSIRYTLLRVTGEVDVDVGIYDLGGSRIGTVASRRESSTAGSVAVWNGSDERNVLVRPGVYICRLRVKTDGQVLEEVRPIAVVY